MQHYLKEQYLILSSLNLKLCLNSNVDLLKIDGLSSRRISDELKKLNIDIHHTTINKIIRYDLTENPCREFVKQRIQLFSEDFNEKKMLIFDNAPQFPFIDYSSYNIYSDYGITGVSTSLASPNMNTFVERLNGTIRREALDHFLLFSEKQVREIISEFIAYYNTQRMHQGTGKIPDAEIQENYGTIKKIRILSGLHHHYYRSSA